MKKIVTILLVFVSFATVAQNTHTQSNANTNEQFQGAVEAKKGFINGYYADTATANLSWIKSKPFAQIVTDSGTVWVRNNLATKWLPNGSIGYIKTLISDSIKANNTLSNGLTSTGGITLTDSTLTIHDTIKYTANQIDYTQTFPSIFTINSADSGYYRRDLIYADADGLHKLVGVQDTAVGVAPSLPLNSIVITIVDIYGDHITPPVPNIIGVTPTWQQTMLQGNSTTEQVVINNASQSPLQLYQQNNRAGYLYFKNSNPGSWAGTGFRFNNDAPSSPYDEHSGNFLQLYMGSIANDLVANGGIIRVNSSGGLTLSVDTGSIRFMRGFPFSSNPWEELGAFEHDGSFRLDKYKNNSTGDSVLSTDENGLLVMKKVSVGDIDVLQNTIDSSSFGIKKLDGTVKNVVVYADGLTGVSGTGIQSIQAGTNVTVDNTDPLNPVVSATGSGSSERFGIEDNTGIQDRYINMQNHKLQMDSLNWFYLTSFGSDYKNYLLFKKDQFYSTTQTPSSQYKASIGNGFSSAHPYYNIYTIDSTYGQSEINANDIGGSGLGKLSISYTQTGSHGRAIILDTGSVKINYSNGITGGRNIIFPTIPSADRYIPVSVNGNYADSTGNITISTGGGSTYTASNGLTMSGNDVKLGGTLNNNTTIYTNGNKLLINGTATYDFALSASNSSGFAAQFSGTKTGAEISSSSSGYFGAIISNNYASLSNNVEGGLSVIRNIGSTSASNGLGVSLNFGLSTQLSVKTSNELISKWTDATDATRTSEFSITGVDNAVTNTLLQISGAGVFTLTQGLTDYTDNAAAISGGLTAGQLYRNGDVVQIVH